MALEAGAQAAAMAQRVLSKGIDADPLSLASQRLSDLAGRHPGAVNEAGLALLDSCEIMLVDIPWPNAISRRDGARTQIIVFDGLRRMIWSFASMITVLALLQAERPSATLDVDGNEVPEALMFSLAATSQLADFVRNGTGMVDFDDLLGDVPRRNVEVGYGVGMLFVLLHEAAHGALGHLDGGAHSELSHVALIQPEILTRMQRDELAADAFAVGLLSDGHREGIVSNLIMTLGMFAMLESFSGGLSAAHPLAINRLAAIAAEAGLEGGTGSIVTSWIEDRVRSFRDLASERAAAGGSIFDRIESSMPALSARTTLRRLKRRILRESGVLGALQAL